MGELLSFGGQFLSTNERASFLTRYVAVLVDKVCLDGLEYLHYPLSTSTSAFANYI